MPVACVVFDRRAKAREPKRADAERAAFQPMRFAQQEVERPIVDGLS
jgi:hypothetical protein